LHGDFRPPLLLFYPFLVIFLTQLLRLWEPGNPIENGGEDLVAIYRIAACQKKGTDQEKKRD
jgi:histone acetyltransferase (RNA polymerase elongator complex component)